MEPFWEGQTAKSRCFRTFTDPDDGRVYQVLKPNFGFTPMLPKVANAVIVTVPTLPDITLPVGELSGRIDIANQSVVDELVAAAVSSVSLDFDLDIVPAKGAYVERFNRTALETLDAATKARDGFEEIWNADFQAEYSLKTGSMLKLRRDITDFMALPHEAGVGSNIVSYHYKFGDQLARRYAGGPSFQNIKGDLRKAICAAHYWDLDFENSYPTILRHAFVCKGGDLGLIPTFARYGQPEHRENMLTSIMNYYCVSRKAAKNCILAHCHGGKMDGRRWVDVSGQEQHTGWVNDWDVSDSVRVKVSREGHLDIVDAIAVEAELLCESLLKAFPEFAQTLAQVNVRLPENKRKTGRMGQYSALSYLMATLEDELLQNLETFLQSRGYDVDSLEFDGLKPRRRDGDQGKPFPADVLRDAEDYLASRVLRGDVRIPMKLSEKPLVTAFRL